MKKLILTLTVLLSFTGLSAQDRAAMDSLQNIIDRAGEALVKKNYPTAACLYNEAITFANEHPDEAITPWRKKNTSAHCQYNLACIYSLTGKKQAALNAFKQALDAGYSNYKWALEDKDLKNIQGESYFKELIRPLAEKYDYAAILKKGGKYSKSAKDAELPAFTYLEVNDPRLVHLRETLNLDSIAGHGDEISRIKNLCLWVHNTVRHDGSSDNPEQKNALALIRICKEQNRGVNCRMLATILNECYLAMGFKSRFVTCLPKSEDDPDCHCLLYTSAVQISVAHVAVGRGDHPPLFFHVHRPFGSDQRITRAGFDLDESQYIVPAGDEVYFDPAYPAAALQHPVADCL